MSPVVTLQGIEASLSDGIDVQNRTGVLLYATVIVDGETKYTSQSIPYSPTLSWIIDLEVLSHSWSTVSIQIFIDEPNVDRILNGIAWASFRAQDLASSTIYRRPLSSFSDDTICGDASFRTETLKQNRAASVSPTPALLGPLPDRLKLWAELEDITDAERAWMHFMPFLSSLGYDILLKWLPPDGGQAPVRSEGKHLLPAENPFKPKVDEAFIHRIVHPTSGLSWMRVGNMARQAYDTRGRLVVLKAVGKKTSEISILRSLNSPAMRSEDGNLAIPLLDVVEVADWVFLVEPWWGLLPFEILAWHVDDYFNRTIQLLEGLVFMHDRRLFHRDLSMRNIVGNHDSIWMYEKGVIPFPLFSEFDMRVGIIDFGLSMQFPAETPLEHCVSADYCGTVTYMAPEIPQRLPGGSLEGQPYQLGPADIYAVGAVALDCLLCERRFIGFQKADELNQYDGTHAIFVLDEFVPEYKSIMDELMDVDPVRRPSAHEALLKLKALRESLPPAVRFAPEAGYPANLDYLRREAKGGSNDDAQ